ncbi:MFS transporter [Actinomadura barringtoniae]|uniref:MFS transporter n=1 Tax=Actinomadura barringtoniae TaxID=1427535 RepID=A0A939PS08_9ACTN|nr:MFS transporter [Actinomadura barringtoniae]MBO2454039.1 MFS transporter [Actinomadura barringtoniae]
MTKNDRLFAGACLGVCTYWVSGGALLAAAPGTIEDLGLREWAGNIAVSVLPLAFGIAYLLRDRIAGRLGRPTMTRVGLVLTVVGALLCAGATGALLMTVGRIVLGAAGAMVVSGTAALTRTTRLVAWVGGSLSIVAGGAVSSLLGWRWVFWLTIPAALAALVLMNEANDVPQKRGPQPILDRSLFARHAFSGAVMSVFLLAFTAVGSLYVVILYLQQGRGMPAFGAALLTLPMAAGLLAHLRVNGLTDRWDGARLPMVACCALAIAGVLAVSFTGLGKVAYCFAVAIGLGAVGLGAGTLAALSRDAAIDAVPGGRAADASAYHLVAGSLGAAFGLAVASSVFAAIVTSSTWTDTIAAASYGVLAAGVAAVLALLAVLALVPAPGFETEKETRR